MTTPFPDAKPSALTTTGILCFAKNFLMSTLLLQTLKPAVGMLCCLHKDFINAFDPSNCAAYLSGPNTLILFFFKKSTIPFTKGSSGPTTTKSIR